MDSRKVMRTMEAMIDEDEQYEEDEEMDDYRSDMPRSKSNRSMFDQGSNSDPELATPDALREGRLSLQESRFSAQPKPSMYGKIAKDIYSQIIEQSYSDRFRRSCPRYRSNNH